jgi:hypothetical protein
MTRALLAALLLQVAPAPQAPSPTSPPPPRSAVVDAALAAFAAPLDRERRAGARALLRDLAPADVDAALAAVGTAPPTSSMLLRETLAQSGRARATLLERATRAGPGELARSLLVSAFFARAAASAPFRAEARVGGDGWPLADKGAWFAKAGDAGAGWSWFEIGDLLEREGVLERPLVVTSECAELGVPVPAAPRVPVEGWCGVAAERASLQCVPLAVGAWLLSAARAQRLGLAAAAGGAPERTPDAGRADRVPARLLESEARLLDAELAALAETGDLRRGVLAAELLRRVGLALDDAAVGSGEPREAAFAKGVELARAARGAGPVPSLDAAAAADPLVAAFVRVAGARDRGPPPPLAPEPAASVPPLEAAARLVVEGAAGRGDPAALRERPAAEVRTIVARAVELTRGRTGRAGELVAALRPVVDAVAGRCADDPLLGGQLVDLLRQEAALPNTGDDEKRSLEAIVQELWALNRGTRPPTRLIVLPPGAAR